jgi:hypothetical protein
VAGSGEGHQRNNICRSSAVSIKQDRTNLRRKDLALAGSAAAASNFAQMSWSSPR